MPSAPPRPRGSPRTPTGCRSPPRSNASSPYTAADRNPPMEIGVAVVGSGNMGRHHVRNYASLVGARLVAVVDEDRGRAEALAERYGAAPLSAIEELSDGVQAVSVATPTATHLDVAGRLLEAGKHVLVEKPIAPTVAEAKALTALAAERGLVLAVGHIERFNP